MWFAVTRSVIRRGSGAGGSAAASATTVDAGVPPPWDESDMIDPSIESQCYSRHRAGASDFVAADWLAVPAAILRDAPPRARSPIERSEIRGGRSDFATL